MIKKILSLILMLCIINIISLPVLAESEDIRESKTLHAEFKTELDVNKASKGEVIQFISTEDYVINGLALPKGTIFNGEIKHFKKGRWGYRRAKAFVMINKIILPNGETYKAKGFTKKRILKGSAVTNTAKGIISFPIAIVTGAVGAVVIIVEAISIAGILLIGPTAYAFGRAMGGLTHGINCKKREGDKIELRIKSIAANSK